MLRPLNIKLVADGTRLEIDQAEWIELECSNDLMTAAGATPEQRVIVSQHPDGRIIVYVAEIQGGMTIGATGFLPISDGNVIATLYRVADLNPSFQEQLDEMAVGLRARGFR